MRHLFDLIPPAWRRQIFLVFFVITLAIMVLLNIVSAPLITPAAPSGIISYEMAGSIESVQTILASWDTRAKLSAAFALGFDYLFMLAYSCTIGLACIWAADALRQQGWPLAGLGVPLAWGQWLAALLDGIENLGLTVILLGNVVSPWPELARVCAIVKFALIFLGLVYAFFGLSVNLVRRLAPRA